MYMYVEVAFEGWQRITATAGRSLAFLAADGSQKTCDDAWWPLHEIPTLTGSSSSISSDIRSHLRWQCAPQVPALSTQEPVACRWTTPDRRRRYRLLS